MPTNITTYANENGTYVVNIQPTDEDGDAVTPKTLTWTLTDEDGSVINSRQDVTISSLSTSMDVILSGADLAIQAGETDPVVLRKFAIKGTYDSSLGNDLPLTDEATIGINNLAAIS